jgi:hypothetical protein
MESVTKVNQIMHRFTVKPKNEQTRLNEYVQEFYNVINPSLKYAFLHWARLSDYDVHLEPVQYLV